MNTFLVATPHSNEICDDKQFLRNEPIPAEGDAPRTPDADRDPALPNGLKELAFSPAMPPVLVVSMDRPPAGSCEKLRASDAVAPGIQRVASVESPAPSVDEKASCGDGQFLRNEPTAAVERSSESHQVDKPAAQTPHINDKKLSPEQLRVLRLERWKENKIRELRAAGWKEPFTTGIP